MDIFEKLLERAQTSVIVRMHVARQSRGYSVGIIAFTGERDGFLACSAEYEIEGRRWTFGGNAEYFFWTHLSRGISGKQKCRELLSNLCATHRCRLSEDVQFIATHEGATDNDSATSPHLLMCLSHLLGRMQVEVLAQVHSIAIEDKPDCYWKELLCNRLLGFIGEQMDCQRLSGFAFLRV